MTRPAWFRAASVVLACVQNLTMGGTVFGWASISNGLLLAQPEDGGPGLSEDEVHSMFVISTSVNFFGPLALGLVLDFFGPRWCNIASVFLVTAGCLIFGLSTPENDYFTLGMALVAFGGPGVQASIVHVSNLYPLNKATITGIMTGSFQLSFMVFYVFSMLWTYLNWSYRHLFVGYAVMCGINTIISIFVWPDTPYDFKEQLKQELHTSQQHLFDRQKRLGLVAALEPTAMSLENSALDEGDYVKLGPVRMPSVLFRAHAGSKASKRVPVSISPPPRSSSRAASAATSVNGDIIRPPPQQKDGGESQHLLAAGAMGSVNAYTPQTDDRNASGGSYTGGRRAATPSKLDSSHAAQGAHAHEHQSSLRRMIRFKDEIKEGTLWQQVTSAPFILLTLFFVVATFWANFYLGTMDIQVGDAGFLSFHQRRVYSQWLTVIMTAGIIVIPLVGQIMDKLGFPATSVVCAVTAVFFALGVMDEQEHMLLTSFIMYALFRTTLFTFAFSYLADVFGFKYYGILAGILFTFAGVFGLLQGPLNMATQGTCHYKSADPDTCTHGHWHTINIVRLACVVMLILHGPLDARDRNARTIRADEREKARALKQKLRRRRHKKNRAVARRQQTIAAARAAGHDDDVHDDLEAAASAAAAADTVGARIVEEVGDTYYQAGEVGDDDAEDQAFLRSEV